MLLFLQNNWANLLVGGLVLALLCGSLWSICRNRRKGASACGCGGCGHCPYGSTGACRRH